MGGSAGLLMHKLVAAGEKSGLLSFPVHEVPRAGWCGLSSGAAVRGRRRFEEGRLNPFGSLSAPYLLSWVPVPPWMQWLPRQLAHGQWGLFCSPPPGPRTRRG